MADARLDEPKSWFMSTIASYVEDVTSSKVRFCVREKISLSQHARRTRAGPPQDRNMFCQATPLT